MIPWASPHYWGNERKYVLEAFDSSWISGGPFVTKLEEMWKASSGAKFALAVSNGTCALHLSYLGAGMKAGDEVIVPGFAFQAAANVAIHMGLVPVFAEVDRATWCLDPDSVKDKITKKTKAIVAVHSYGNSCDMPALMDIASSHGLLVIEDAAEAIGTFHCGCGGKSGLGPWVGTIGDIGTYSLHATKTIATGEGGMVVTNDAKKYELMATYRSHGMGKKRYWHEVPGHNFRMPNVVAAIGCGQMEHIVEIFGDRKKIYESYMDELSCESGIFIQGIEEAVDPIPWTFPCMLDPKLFGPRDEVIEKLLEAGIESRPGFYPASVQPIYKCDPLPCCEEVAKHVISLPGSPPFEGLDIKKICSTLLSLRKE